MRHQTIALEASKEIFAYVQLLHRAQKKCQHHQPTGYLFSMLKLTASDKKSSMMGGSHCPCCCGARLKDRFQSFETNLFGCYLLSAGIERCWVVNLHLDHHQQEWPRWGSDHKSSSPLKTFLAAGLVVCLYRGELRSAASVPVLDSSQNQDAGPPFPADSLAASIFRPTVDKSI